MPDEKPITGVVLIGGQSSRMGTPKALLPLEGKPMFLNSAEKLSQHFNQVYLSHRENLFTIPDNPYPVILDLYETISPMTGILSVLETIQTPIFILPTDMPEIEDFLIQKLLTWRVQDEICTVFYHEHSGYYEPLVGIWEIHAIPVLQKCLQDKNLSFQKLLEKNHVTKHFLDTNDELTNINTSGEFNSWKNKHFK